MPEYTYKASDRTGKVIEGSIDAGDEAAVITKIRGMGYIPIRIVPAGGAKKFSPSFKLNLDFSLPTPFTGISGKDLLSFTQELATLIKAGLPLDRSISIVAEITDNEKMGSIAEALYKDVRGGKAFSEALSQHPRVFNRLYCNMIKAGEAGGVLDVVLDRLVEFLERSQELKSTITNALIYPLFLITVMGFVISILLIFVLPRFITIFDTMGQEIPLSTQMLLTFSNIITGYWWLILGAGIGGYCWFQNYVKTPQGRQSWDSLKLRVAAVRSLIIKVEVSRLTRTLGTLINSGVPLLQALTIVRDIIGNVVIARAVSTIQTAVKEGKGVSMPMKNTGLFPSLAVHMIRVGEETGRMDEMLIKVADTFDKDIQNTIKRFVSLMEPALILIMALAVVAIILPIILAIFSINDMSF